MDKKIIIVSSIIFFLCNSFDIYAQSKEKCLKEFGIEKITGMENSELLVDYFICRAIVKDDINECNKLTPKNVKICHEYFNSLNGFWVKLLRINRVTKEILDACKNSSKSDRKTCSKISEGFIKGDVSVCDTTTFFTKIDCKGLIMLNESIAIDERVKNLIRYLKAIKDSKAESCGIISQNDLRLECGAYLTKNYKICEQNEDFEKLRNEYCSGITKEEKR